MVNWIIDPLDALQRLQLLTWYQRSRCRCGASFDVEIATAAFEGKRLLERHRIVNTALTEELKDIHALSISKALTPQQWSDQKSSPPAVKEQLAHQPGAVEQPAAATA